MRHFTILLIAFAFATSGAQAQFDTTTVRVEDNAGRGIPGTRVFWFEDGTAYMHYLNNTMLAGESKWTDSNGHAQFVFFAPNPMDTFYYATLDCQGGIDLGGNLFQNFPDTVTLSVSCAPQGCQSLQDVRYDSATGEVIAYSAPLRNPAYVSNPSGSPVREWTFNGTSRNGNNVRYTPNAPTDSVVYCYRQYANCPWQCDTMAPFQTGGSTPFCKADYFVDTVNSLNYQGQLILGENAFASPGQVVAWEWDFGDGTIKNGQYPQHTYNGYGVYNICLTITAIDGNDTCYSTYCDSVGIDTSGNLVFKDGFTVNVIDPATFGLEGQKLRMAVSLYPNPTRGAAQLSWPAALPVQEVSIYNLSGQRLESLSTQETSLELPTLKPGSYLLRLQTEYGPVQRRLIVR